MKALGTIKQIDDLRSVWSHEAHDFSKWLAEEENLAKLSEEIGIDIVLEELESPVGGFSVDLFATEDGTGRKIIIENQLEETNHDHLGKIITYASGKDAEVLIWIVKHARDEHRQAVEWLNQHMDSNIGIFLVEIELWQINDSPYAPKFNVVERPNDWAKSVKAAEGLSETKKLQVEFWQAFCNYAFAKPEFAKCFNKRKALPHNWYELSLGKSIYSLNLSVDTQKRRVGAYLYISDNKLLFQKFKHHQTEIEQMWDTKLEWIEATKACRILATMPGDIKKGPESWMPMFDWFIQSAMKIRQVVQTFDT